MLRQCGRLRLLGKAPFPVSSLHVALVTELAFALSMPKGNICCVRSIETDSQSDWFKLCDLLPIMGAALVPTTPAPSSELVGCHLGFSSAQRVRWKNSLKKE